MEARHEQYGNLNKGDLVRIKGETGATFKVMWVDEYVERPAEITVIGGSHGHTSWRTFVIDRVVKKPKKQQVTR